MTTRKEILTYANTLTLLPPQEVSTPGPENDPIEGLELISNGWKCIYENCEDHFLSGTIVTTTMENHCRIHGWRVRDPPMWEKCSMQTFFKGNHIKYFEVKAETQDEVNLDTLLDDLLEEADRLDEEYNLTLNQIKETNIVTKTPWLNRTGWEKKFKGKDMEVLAKLTEKPKVNEVQMSRLWQSTSRVIKKCWTGAQDISDRNWDLILFWLNSAHSEKAELSPFNLTTRDQTIERYMIFGKLLTNRYAEYWQRFLCFCYRVHGYEETYGVHFLDEQTRILQGLKTALDEGFIDDESLDRRACFSKDITD